MNKDEEARAHIAAQRASMIEVGLALMGMNVIVSKGMVHLTLDQFEELFEKTEKKKRRRNMSNRNQHHGRSLTRGGIDHIKTTTRHKLSDEDRRMIKILGDRGYSCREITRKMAPRAFVSESTARRHRDGPAN